MKKKKIITRQEIMRIIEKYRIRLGPFTLEDGLIYVNGNVKICYTKLTKLPLRFRNVYGNFLCHSNKLTSLKGSPIFVAGDFICYGNENLTSLKYGPEEVGGDYSCQANNLTSLKGSPKIINGNFNCFSNQITTLKDGPDRVEGNCYSYLNELISLQGSPIHIGGSFNVSGNPLRNLVGCPEYIGEILSFDNTVSIFMSEQNCEVKRVEIQIQDRIYKPEFILPQVIIDNHKYLPVIFKYNRYLELFSEEMVFNDVNFNDILLDINEGLR